MSNPTASRQNLVPAPALVAPGRARVARAGLAFAAWACAAAVAGVALPLADVPPLVPLLLGGTVMLMVASYLRFPAFRALTERVSTRTLVAAHAVRAPIGLAFLIEYAHGRLPATFAERAGWGDLAAGLAAVGAALACGAARARLAAGPTGAPGCPAILSSGTRRALVLTWNVGALIDILMVVATAQYLVLGPRDARMIDAFGSFPYGLLPTLVVPLVIASHLLVFARLRAARAHAHSVASARAS